MCQYERRQLILVTLDLKYRDLKYRHVHWCKNRVDEGLDQDPSSLARIPKQWRDRPYMVCAHLLSPGFPPSELFLSSPTSLACCQCCLFMLQRGKQRFPTLCLIEPLPDLLAALAAFMRWFSLCSEWLLILILYIVLYGAALYLCFSRTVPLSFTVFPCFCFLFKLCIEFFCVYEIKAFINLVLFWRLFLKRT